MNRIYSIVAAVGVLSFGMALPAPAQVQINPVFDMGALTNTLSQGALIQSERRRATRMHDHSKSSSSKQSASGGGMRGTFTTSESVRKRVMDSFVTKARAADPQGAAEMERVFATQKPFSVMGKWMARYGMSLNSVADAMATYAVVAWNGARGSNDDPQKAQILGVRDQFARALGSTTAFARLSDAKKQELADTLLLDALLYDASIGAAKKKPETMPQVRATIAKGALSTLKLDVNAFQLTNAGLRRG